MQAPFLSRTWLAPEADVSPFEGFEIVFLKAEVASMAKSGRLCWSGDPNRPEMSRRMRMCRSREDQSIDLCDLSEHMRPRNIDRVLSADLRDRRLT